jgi:hypothetical protein
MREMWVQRDQPSGQPFGRWLVRAVLVASLGQGPLARAEEPAAGGQAPLSVDHAPPSLQPRQDEAEERAARLLQQAKERFAEGDYQSSVSLLEEAYALTHSPRFLMNLGVAHHYLNECETALGYYRQYLQADPRGDLRAEATAAVERLEPICGGKSEPRAADVGAAPNPPPAPVALSHSPAQPSAAALFHPPPPTRVGERAPWVGVSRWMLLSAGAATAVGSVTLGLLALHAKSARESLQRSLPPGQTWDDFAGKSRDTELQRGLRRDQLWCWVFAGSSVLFSGTAGALWLIDSGPRGSVGFSADGFAGLQYERQF